jgi:hypothetical protein
MDSAKIRDWLEIVGIFGVIASLIFVGMEMRQSQQIAIATINSQRADTTVQLATAAASNPVFLSAAEKVESGGSDALTYTERQALRLMFGANQTRVSDTYWQHVNGFVPEHRWLGVRAEYKRTLTVYPQARAVAENDAGISGPMSEVIDVILAEIDAGK